MNNHLNWLFGIALSKIIIDFILLLFSWLLGYDYVFYFF